MYDSFNRKIDYLRISITDRCNLRCRYCMPEEGVPSIGHDAVLRYEEIVEVAREAAALGMRKIRITGGEPLVRKGVEELVAALAAIDGIEDLAMTTNGLLLEGMAQTLKKAGLHRVNISLDTLDRARFAEITRFDAMDRVLAGIEAAEQAGLTPIKINTVVDQSALEPDAESVTRFAIRHGYEIRYIRKMDLVAGDFWPVQGGEGGDCSRCNRLRLTSDGYVRPCLFSDLGFSVRELGTRQALLAAVAQKPEAGHVSQTATFYGLGG